MLEIAAHEHVCPSCQENFYPEQKAVSLVLCGDEHICYPPGKSVKASECKSYYFCSNECADDLESRISSCKPESSFKRFMTRIKNVSIEKGIAGTRIHDLYKSDR